MINDISIGRIDLTSTSSSSKRNNNSSDSNSSNTVIPIARIIRIFFERMGATYIKLGQFIASSPSLFPIEVVDEFQVLLDDVNVNNPIPMTDIRKIVTQELQKTSAATNKNTISIDDEFESISELPIASASIAQVHSAILKRSRKEVVLKVQKPDVKQVLQADLAFVVMSLKFMEVLFLPELKRTSIVGILEDIQQSMIEECDFIKEANNIEVFQRYLDTNNITSAKAPFVYKQLSTSKLLVLERFKGSPLTDLDAIRRVYNKNSRSSYNSINEDNGLAEATLVNTLNTWLGSVLLAESFHADVHAGNLLVLEDGKIGFIDFGIVGKISPSTWGSVQLFMESAGRGDSVRMARSLATMGATDQEVDIDALAKDISNVMSGLLAMEPEVMIMSNRESNSVAASLQVDEREVNRLLIDVIQMGESHGLKFPREFGLLLKQLLYFDRYTKLLAPDLTLTDERVSWDGKQYLG